MDWLEKGWQWQDWQWTYGNQFSRIQFSGCCCRIKQKGEYSVWLSLQPVPTLFPYNEALLPWEALKKAG